MPVPMRMQMRIKANVQGALSPMPLAIRRRIAPDKFRECRV